MGFAEREPLSRGQPDVAGDAASPAALTRLEGAVGELKALAIVPMLRRAIDALRADDAKTGSEWALKALNQDERSGMAWYVLAVAREKAGDFASSLQGLSVGPGAVAGPSPTSPTTSAGWPSGWA